MSFYKTLFASPILSSSLALFFPPFISFFFFNDTATTEIYTLSLHDALPISVRAEIRDGEHEVERAAQLVEPSWIPAHERLALLVGQVGGAHRGGGVAPEPLAERAVLLEAIQQHGEVVTAHSCPPWGSARSHSSAARSMRPISPKKRTRARAGATAPSSTIQFSSSCEPVACSSFAVSPVRLACSPRSIQPTKIGRASCRERV